MSKEVTALINGYLKKATRNATQKKFEDKKTTITSAVKYAPVAKLAYAPDLGSGGKPCRFKSCQAHHICSGLGV